MTALTDKLEALLAAAGQAERAQLAAVGPSMHTFVDRLNAESALSRAACSALPALLRVVRAAEAWREAADPGTPYHNSYQKCEAERAYLRELRAALDALKEA